MDRPVASQENASSRRQTNQYVGDYFKLEFVGMFHTKEETTGTSTHSEPQQ